MQLDTQEIQTVMTMVLEDMAFLFVDDASPGELPDGCEQAIEGHIRFEGDGTGELTVLCSQALMREIGANLLGQDADEVSEDEAMDAMGEIINVFMGRILTTVFGDKPVFSLSTPTVTKLSIAETWTTTRSNDHTLACTADDEPLMALFHVDTEPSMAA